MCFERSWVSDLSLKPMAHVISEQLDKVSRSQNDVLLNSYQPEMARWQTQFGQGFIDLGIAWNLPA